MTSPSLEYPYKVIVLPDIHCPAEDRKTLAAVEEYMKDFQPDEIIYLGDFMDLNCISSHNAKNLRAVESQRILKDFDAGNKILTRHEELVSGATRTFITGNHENRLNRYVDSNPQLEGILDIRELLCLDARGYNFVPFWETGESYTIGKATFIHGEYTNDNHSKSTVGAYVENVFYGHCFDDKTEILTSSGWKKRDELTVGLPVMTLNKDSKKFEFNQIRSITSYNNTEPLHHISGRSIDLLVTGKHGLVDSKNKLGLYTAENYKELCTRNFICAGTEDRAGLDHTDDEIRLCVWIAADGAIENVSKSGVRFHLKKQRKITRLTQLLARLDIPYSNFLTKTGTRKIYISKKNLQNIWELFADQKKQLPQCFGWASAEQARIILEEYSHTDGCKTGPNSVQISTSKEQEADMLQSLFVTSSLRCTKLSRKNGFILSVNTAHPVTELHTTDTHDLVPHEGIVWCVNVENGTLLVRRNGKVCVDRKSTRLNSSHT